MVRKIIIVVLTLGAVGAFLLGTSGYFVRTDCSWRLTDHTYVSIKYVNLLVRFYYVREEVPEFYIDRTYCYQDANPHRGWQTRTHGWRRFDYRNFDDDRGRRRWAALPFWVPVLILGIFPALAFIRDPLRRYRRRKRGLCMACGYDLRGSPGRCPECGAG